MPQNNPLPPEALAYLFPEPLYLVKANHTSKTSEQGDLVVENPSATSKQVELLVILPDPSILEIDGMNALLQNILNAIGQKPEEATILYEEDLIKRNSPLTQHYSFQHCLAFGVKELDPGPDKSTALNRWLELGSGWLLVTHSLEELNAEKDKKLALWNTLKIRFHS